MHKLGIVVPYRDRSDQLREFIREVPKFISHHYPVRVNYEIIIVNQQDRKQFNRGKLLNIGFLEAERQGCDYVIFHDIDMIPVEGSYLYNDEPLQLANNFIFTKDFKRTISREYFGGVTLFPLEDFRKINGYSNKYRGWGFEDNDLLLRAIESKLPLKKTLVSTPPLRKTTLKFNGKNSMVKVPNKFNFVRPISFVCSFTPDAIKTDPIEITDEFAVFGIPGQDLNLSYNSFSTYKFELFLVNDVTLSIATESLPNMPVRAIVTIDPKNKVIEFFVNGRKVGQKEWDEYHIRRYSAELYLYLGVAAPDRDSKKKHFKGTIDSFAVFNKVLSREEVKNISTNITDSLLTDEPFGYSEELVTYYDTRTIQEGDTRLKDLSPKENSAAIVNCKTEYIETESYVVQSIPKRRRCKYRLLKHEEGGYKDGYWVDWQSRKNQMYYYHLIEQGRTGLEEDGLSTLKYTELSRRDFSVYNKYTQLNVRT